MPRAAPELNEQTTQDDAAERTVIGCCLVDPDRIDDVSMFVQASDFRDEAHKLLWSVLLEMHGDARKIDSGLFVAALKKRKCGDTTGYEFIGGAAYLARVMEAGGIPAHAKYHAQIVREKALLRGLWNAGNAIIEGAASPSADPEEVLAAAEQSLMQIEDRRVTEAAMPMADVLEKHLRELERRQESGGDVQGVRAGFREVEEFIPAFKPGELIIVAARPGMGKSVLAMNLATHAALHECEKVLFLSLEMSRSEISDRMLSSIASVPHYAMVRGNLNRDDREKITEAAGVIGSCNRLWLDDTAGRKVSQIGAICRRMKRKHGLGMLVIDYLQLLTPDNDRDNRQEQIAKMTRRLKTLARDLEIPILCLAQLNRESEKTGDNKPKLSHLRESGAIEQDADVVLLIYRADQYLPPARVKELELENIAEIIVAKQRNGRQGVAKLRWNGAMMRFEGAGLKAEDWDPFAN